MGMAPVLVGIGLVGLPALRNSLPQRRNVLLALSVGLSIVAYSRSSTKSASPSFIIYAFP